jgi:hypothetical protein
MTPSMLFAADELQADLVSVFPQLAFQELDEAVIRRHLALEQYLYEMALTVADLRRQGLESAGDPATFKAYWRRVTNRIEALDALMTKRQQSPRAVDAPVLQLLEDRLEVCGETIAAAPIELKTWRVCALRANQIVRAEDVPIDRSRVGRRRRSREEAPAPVKKRRRSSSQTTANVSLRCTRMLRPLRSLIRAGRVPADIIEVINPSAAGLRVNIEGLIVVDNLRLMARRGRLPAAISATQGSDSSRHAF